MTTYLLYIILNLSIILAALVIIFRHRKLPPELYPFSILLLLGCLNELLSVYLVFHKYSNSINGNIFILLEFILLLIQFYKWNTITYSKCRFILLLGVALWAADNFLINTISANNSVSRIVYAFLFVFLSIDMINRRIIFGKQRSLHATSLIIATGILIFYACKTFVEVFNAFDLGFSNEFYAHVWFSLAVVNAFTNILYAIALLWIPTKQRFLLLS